MTIIENLKWRYATKKFDASKKVSQKDLDVLKEAIQLSASSFGFQPYQVYIVENIEIRKQLQVASYGQSQIVDASHLLVFAANIKTDAVDVDALMELTAKTRGLELESLKGFSDYVKGAISWMPIETQTAWNTKQVYLALGNALTVCAEMNIDACPMEGFIAADYNKILELETKGLTAAVVLPIGYRSTEDTHADYPKVRKDLNELFKMV